MERWFFQHRYSLVQVPTGVLPSYGLFILHAITREFKLSTNLGLPYGRENIFYYLLLLNKTPVLITPPLLIPDPTFRTGVLLIKKRYGLSEQTVWKSNFQQQREWNNSVFLYFEFCFKMDSFQNKAQLWWPLRSGYLQNICSMLLENCQLFVNSVPKFVK